MTIGFGLAILILIELYRSYRDKWREPSHGKILNMVRDSLVPIDRKNISKQARDEALHLKFIYRDRDLYGDTSLYRVRNIREYADFLASQARITEASNWYDYAIRIIEHNAAIYINAINAQDDSKQIAKINELALDARIAQGRLYKHDSHRHQSIDSLRKAVDLAQAPETKVVALTLLVQALAYDDDVDEALELGGVLLSITQEAHGHDARQVVEILVLLRDIETGSGSGIFTELYEILTSLDAQESVLGKDHFLLAEDLGRLAAYYRRRRDWEYARAVEKRADMLVLLHRVQRALDLGNNGLDSRFGALRTTHQPSLLRDVETVASWLEERGQAVDKHVAFHLRKRVGGAKK